MNYAAVGMHDFYSFLLALARVSGMLAAAPPFNNKAIPMQTKIGLAVVFSMALTPTAAALAGPIPTILLLFVADILKNALFGLALGYVVMVMFEAVEMTGQLVDLQIGFNFMSELNPLSGNQVAIISTFLNQVGVAVFLLANGHLILLGALADSLQALPPTTVSPHGAFGFAVVPVIKIMLGLGFRYALPMLAAIFVTDVALGLTARLAPQIPVFLVGLPAKVIIGIATLAIAFPVISIMIGQVIAGAAMGMRALTAAGK